MPTSTRTIDKGAAGKFQVTTRKTANPSGGVDVEESSTTLREPEAPQDEKPSDEKPSQGHEESVTLAETLLFLLIIVNGITSKQFKSIWQLIILQQEGAKSTVFLRRILFVLAGEFVALIALSLAAKSSASANKVVLTFIGALWLGWLVHNGPALAGFVATVQPTRK